MIKQLLLIAALVPTASVAHDFNQDRWLQRWLNNRINIGKCLKLTTTDIPTFRQECDLDNMVIIENKENARLELEMLRHPLDDALQFANDHWARESDEFIWGVYLNIEKTPDFAVALLKMYIVMGLTEKGYAVHTPE